MLLLSDEQVQKLITADMCLKSLEQAYRELGKGWAGNTKRSEIITANAKSDNQEPCHGLKSMMGRFRGLKPVPFGSIRISSPGRQPKWG